jgi:cAMP-dependent protein kinase regulator
MEVTVVDTGDLPTNTILSLNTGSIRRHVLIEKDKVISLSTIATSDPVRVDLMSEVGNHTFDMVPGQDVYEVPISSLEKGGTEVRLKFQIREASAGSKANGAVEAAVVQNNGAGAPKGGDSDFTPLSPNGPSRKLQNAMMMRSYLDNHDVLRQMQDLLQEMVTFKPDDPIEHMIKRLEQVCRELPASKGAEKKQDDEEEEEDDDDDEAGEMPPPPPQMKRDRKCSVSEEAYGAFNQRKAYEAKVVSKDAKQKARLKEVLKHCWMFNSQSAENLNVIADAMTEKIVPADVTLVKQGDEGDVMWVIEGGQLQCFKKIDGEEKLVKTCKRGDVFGELALLYNCPRAASVVSKENCILWELDRETFKAICYEAAKKGATDYEGFDPNAKPAEEEVQQEEDHHSDSDDEMPEPAPMAAKPKGKRREGVSAEATQANDGDWTPPVHAKSPEEREQLSTIINTSRDSKLHMLFGTVPKETFTKIVDAMELKKIAKDENVIEQGGVGDYFYIVKSGDFDIFVKKGEDPPKKVFQAGVGFAFGELALLYNAPRSATITASCDAEVWALDRVCFRNLVVRSAEAQFRQRVEFLNAVDVFHVLNENERAALAEVLEEEEFEDDEAIVEQGEKDDKMFILRSGKAVACIKGEQGEVEVMQYSNGSYFGEIALLSGEPRKASVYSVGPCTCLYISRSTFLRVLGPLQSLLERNISKYEKYHDAIKNAEAEGEEAQIPPTPMNNEDGRDDEDFEGGGVAGTAIKKKVNRKRDRPSDTMEVVEGAHKVSKDMGPDGEVATLADKVALDFKRPQLVTPCSDFSLPDGLLNVFGGLIPGQKFTMDKVIHVSAPSCTTSQDGEDDLYRWQQPSKLQQATEIGMLCQKGQKSASDPTPNQDNFFIRHVGSVSMYGVCDGHGPFGHLVSFRLVQSLPYYLCKSEHFGKDWALALKNAFLSAQKDLQDFCKSEDINIEASGAAGSVLVFEEQTVHIAFIGDARVMLGSWNRRDSRLIFCTQDHKPDLPEEKARLEKAGSEVREIDPGNSRIYLPGSNFPGLTMSRAFGDTACEGVLREPEYHKHLMQPTDQWYAIVASDGVWEFMSGEEVCNMTSKKLRLKGPRETLNFVVNASRKRWAYCCGEYCDDITAILIQWNSADHKDSKVNHLLSVKRNEKVK